jgi:tetratricopeptide (TPR) repeat protein
LRQLRAARSRRDDDKIRIQYLAQLAGNKKLPTSLIHRLSAGVLLTILVTGHPCRGQGAGGYTEAESLVREGQVEQGIKLLKPILQTEPRNLKARNLLGIALTQQGELAAANREFSRAVQIDPRFYPALQNLAANEFALKDFAASERHFLQAVKLAPDSPAINSFLGKLVFKRGDFAAAVPRLEKATSLFDREPALAVALVQSYFETDKVPDALRVLAKIEPQKTPVRAQFQLALVLARHDRFAEATPYFEAIQSQFPSSYDASFNLAVCYVETKQFPKAIQVLLLLKSSGRKTAEVDNLLAEAYQADHQLQPAIDALREATRLAPDDEDSYIDLVALCIDHDSLDLAMEVLDVGLHYRPESDRLIFQRGIVHAMKNKFDLAEQDFQLASRLAPEKNLSYAGLGVTYMQTGNLPEAIRTLGERVVQKPDDATLRYLLGDALIRSGVNPGDAAFDKAKSTLERSVAINSGFAPARVDLAKLYLRENRTNEAVDLLEKARGLDPEDKAVYSQLAVAYRRQGKAELSAATLATLAKLNESARVRDSHARTRLVKQDPDTGTTP